MCSRHPYIFLVSGASILIYESVYLIYICSLHIPHTFPKKVKKKTNPYMFTHKHRPPRLQSDAVLVEAINYYLTYL